MKKNILLVLIIFIYTNLFAQGQIINVPADQPTIQTAINASVNGDTVLVADGTYFENINFKGKAVILASHFLVDGDETHIDSTIINGSQPTHPDHGVVVEFNSGEDTTSVLYGFTITGGTGQPDPYGYGTRGAGGIAINSSGAKIQYNKITDNIVTHNAYAEGGGIVINAISNDVLILDNYITNNKILTSVNNGEGGGGILIYKCLNHRVIITNNVIANNVVSKTDGSPTGGGGGIFLNLSKALLKNNLIKNNKAYYGGGVEYNSFPGSTEILFINNTVVNNKAVKGGGYCGVDSEKLPQVYNSIFWGNTATTSPQFYFAPVIRYSNVQDGHDGAYNIDQDPMFADTVNFYLEPLSPCVDAGAPYLLCADTEDPLNPNVPLSALGNLRNDMGAYGGNLQTLSSKVDRTVHVPKIVSKIQNAINASQEGDTVLVAGGTYFENINFRGKAITVASHFILDQDTLHISKTIIDGSQPSHPDSGSAVSFLSGEDITSVLCGFTITGGTGTINPPNSGYDAFGGGGILVGMGAGAKIHFNKITNNSINYNSLAAGGGIIIDSPVNQVVVENNYITNNKLFTQQGAGGGIMCINSQPELILIAGNVISDNQSNNGSGGGIYIDDASVVIRNNLIKNNTSANGIKIINHPDPGNYKIIFMNNTVVYNEGEALSSYSPNSTPVITNSIFWGNNSNLSQIEQILGQVLVSYSNIEGSFEGTGNIDLDPLFEDKVDYCLSSSSLCIDAGDPDAMYNDLDGSRNDMGCYGGQSPLDMPTNVKEITTVVGIPNTYTLSQNYPNPFNPTTKIQYSILEKSLVTLIVYNVLGKEVKTLVNENQNVGKYEINFDASDLSSGVYFYKLTSGYFAETKKMILLR